MNQTYNYKYLYKSLSMCILNSSLKRTVPVCIRKHVISENKSFLHTSIALTAGHSKWQNIKHTKALHDNQKAVTINRLSQQIRKACKEGGSTDPKVNSILAKVLEQAKKANMPSSSIENALKKAEKSNENAKPGVITLQSTMNLAIVLDVISDNLNRTRNDVRAIGKKMNFAETRSLRIQDIFEERGLIITKATDIDKAMDDAIEAGAEDVKEEDGMFIFECSASDFYKVRNKIESMNYEIEYANVDRIPYEMVPFAGDETAVNKTKLGLSKLEEHLEIVKLYSNFEL